MAVYDFDVELRIEQAEKAVEGFQEEWTQPFPDNENNTSYSFYVMYGNSPLDHVVVVNVDGGRAWIPVPDRPESDSEPWTISSYENSIAGAINKDRRSYRERLDMSGVEVR